MEPIHIRQRLRPSRYTFIVNEGDLGAALQAASLNAALWGGLYNPIVPLTPADTRDGLLKAFDPDYLVNLTGAALPEELVARYEHRIVEADYLVRRDSQTNRRELALGLNILPLLHHVREKHAQFPLGGIRAAVIKPQTAPGWPEFTAFAYGSFHWLPEMDIDFEEAFRRELKARTVNLPDLALPPDYEALLLPLDFTGYGIRLLGSTSFPRQLIFIGDHRNLTDLIEFWNIRAMGCSVVFVPVEAYRAFEPLIRLVMSEDRYCIDEQVEHYALLQKGLSVTDSVFDEVCDWIATLGVGQLARHKWPPRFGVGSEGFVGDIQVAELEVSEGEEISILQDGQMTPVKMIAPPFLANGDTHMWQFRWAVEIALIGAQRDAEFMFQFPREPAVEAVVGRAVIGMPGDVRLGRSGLVVQQNWLRSTLYLRPVPTKDVFHALFRQAGLEAEPSEPGQYAEQIIKKMGSLHGGCRVFKVRGVREILDRLGRGSMLTRGNMYAIVMSQTPDEHGQNWRPDLYEDLILRRDQRRPLDFETIFDVLLEKRIIRPGFEFRCPSCFKKDWYHVSQFTEEYTCRFCFTPQRVDFGSKHEWLYKADGLFQIPDSAQGSVAVILSLWRFEHLAVLGLRHGRYVTSQKLVAKDTGRHYEIDYAYVLMGTFDSSYDLIIGEAKGFRDLADEDVQKMAEIADRFQRKPYLSFSTLKDRYSDTEKSLLHALAQRGYKVIALTREELDPYDLFERFDRAPHKYTLGVKELSENTLYLNVG